MSYLLNFNNWLNESRMILEQNPAGSTISPEAQAQIDKMVAETKAIAEKHINSTLKLDLKGGGSYTVESVRVYSRSQLATGGIGIEVKWGIDASPGRRFSMDFPIYGVENTKTKKDLTDVLPAGYMGGSDPATAKTYFDNQFSLNAQTYWKTTGDNYTACRDGIWNGILAVADKYNKTGVAIK